MTPNTTSDQLETVADPERGCGHLREGKAYLRSDVSPDGVLPAFVEFDQPVPFLEGHFRGYSHFPGVQFEATATPTENDYLDAIELTDSVDMAAMYKAVQPEAVRDAPDDLDALAGVEPDGEWLSRVSPPLEGDRHVTRLRADGVAGMHVGEMRVGRAHDLLMHVGESYYPEPADFIRECKTLGLSKAIPVSETQDPPVVNPGRTRVWLVHPNACPGASGSYDVTEDIDDGVPGVIGYAYVTRCIYTATTVGGESEFPEWAHEHAAAGRMDLVEIGEQIPADQHENGTTIDDYTGESDGDGPEKADMNRAEDTERERGGE